MYILNKNLSTENISLFSTSQINFRYYFRHYQFDKKKESIQKQAFSKKINLFLDDTFNNETKMEGVTECHLPKTDDTVVGSTGECH